MMISTWVSVIVVLVVFTNGVRNEDDTQPCAKVHTSSSVVPLRSNVTATCVIREDCLLVVGQAVHIEWSLDNRFIPSSPVANESDRVSRVVISSFNYTRAVLTCSIQASHQVVAGVEIRAGYPPESPQNLSCQTNLTTPHTLTCRWDPGQQETYLPTKYTLHTEIRDSNKNYTYEPPPGVHSYIITRSDFSFFVEMKIYVKAENDLGENTSVPIILEPLSAAKLEQPNIVQVVTDTVGCLNLSWSLSQQQNWMRHNDLNLEVRLKTTGSSQRSNQIIVMKSVKGGDRVPSVPVTQCRLLHGTRYSAQIRVRYKESPWSKWSSSHSGVTLEQVPTGRLDTWMKVSGDTTSAQLNIQLFWKPSKQFHANSLNVSYTISVQTLHGTERKICSTSENYCTFKLPEKVKKVCLYAVNGAGKSNANEVRIYQSKVQTGIIDVTAVPNDDKSFLVQWKRVITSGLTGYVVEWLPLLKTGPSHIQFEKADKKQSSLIITGNFEPYKPFGISVYPRFKDGIGLPQTVNAYVRQKAPSEVPRMLIKKTWNSHIEITWGEIPLEQRNGIIQNYKVFYGVENGPVDVISANPEERKVILTNLKTASMYEAFMMVSTSGGSLNGSTIRFEVQPFDGVAIVIIVITCGVGLSLLIIVTVMICFSKPKSSRLQGRFWPVVPDPANSSIKRWASESTQYTHPSWDNEEPNPIYLSHLSFLDLTTKLSKEEDDLWLNSSENTSDLGESICGSPFIPGYTGSNSDSVPYATVIFSGPYSSPPPMESHVYLRSESTQPLLASEESFSPKCYQNMAANEMHIEQCFFGPNNENVPERGEDRISIWDDFPFLQALAINDTEND
ncbi:granulocyte colony-stimulating factor receptor [Melanotaenia boesemani]|uniref:granulocyte colony-stimulating factor receptor n=1 Tax=Melanotaenia boesemani TaxID=1250792 RepID=UPI001C03F327|nr:granulocyte colony-stimulating factor receptor [Melanotaenia boesemani]